MLGGRDLWQSALFVVLAVALAVLIPFGFAVSSFVAFAVAFAFAVADTFFFEFAVKLSVAITYADAFADILIRAFDSVFSRRSPLLAMSCFRHL